jgi:hypothetical protein
VDMVAFAIKPRIDAVLTTDVQVSDCFWRAWTF